MSGLRHPAVARARALASSLGVLGAIQSARRAGTTAARYLLDPDHRARRRHARSTQDQLRDRAHRFAGRHRALFGSAPQPARGAMRVLCISSTPPWMEIEVCLIRALQAAGCDVTAVDRGVPDLSAPYHQLVQPMRVEPWTALGASPSECRNAAWAVLEQRRTAGDLLRYCEGPIEVGKAAVSTAMRRESAAHLDFDAPGVRESMVGYLAEAMAAAQAAMRLAREWAPDAVLVADTAYTPLQQVLDACTAAGIPVIRWYPGHRNSVLMLKRYTASNHDADLHSLSATTWEAVKDVPLTGAQRADLDEQLTGGYVRQDWYGEAGTQFGRRLTTPEDVRQRLGLAPGRKAAFVFPHISWDASFSRGRDLFASYEEWLLETMRAACANPALHWFIKIHPAHVGKAAQKGVALAPSEDASIRASFGTLPPHVTVLPADFELSTHSLFPVMDYCLTVRGTTGIEAARLGIPAVLGGTGRYDHRGFTIDSESPAEYLARLAHLQDLPRLTPAQIALAERFAHALFCRRPLSLTSVVSEYSAEHGGQQWFSHVDLRITQPSEWATAPDLSAFARWVITSHDEDFLADVPQ